jgi:uncharacterized phage infection (PIP) family protein YhgE
MDINDLKTLIDTFKGYRDLLTPIQNSLSDFAQTFGQMKKDIEKLNQHFGEGAQKSLDKLYKDLSEQAQKTADLFSRIDKFVEMANKYTDSAQKFAALFEKVESGIRAVDDIERKAAEQIGKLDAILEEKKKSYNIKELERTLENYNDNVTKVSEFINKEVADSLNRNYQKLESIKSGNDFIAKKLEEEKTSIQALAENYASSAELLKRLTEKNDVNEEYIFEIIDKWAQSRKVKTKN